MISRELFWLRARIADTAFVWIESVATSPALRQQSRGRHWDAWYFQGGVAVIDRLRSNRASRAESTFSSATSANVWPTPVQSPVGIDRFGMLSLLARLPKLNVTPSSTGLAGRAVLSTRSGRGELDCVRRKLEAVSARPKHSRFQV